VIVPGSEACSTLVIVTLISLGLLYPALPGPGDFATTFGNEDALTVAVLSAARHCLRHRGDPRDPVRVSVLTAI
jgi:hypothetical protein